MRCSGIQAQGFLSGLSAEEEKHSRRDDEIQQGGRDKTADDDNRDRVEDLLPRLASSEHQRHKRDASAQRRH